MLIDSACCLGPACGLSAPCLLVLGRITKAQQLWCQGRAVPALMVPGQSSARAEQCQGRAVPALVAVALIIGSAGA